MFTGGTEKESSLFYGQFYKAIYYAGPKNSLGPYLSALGPFFFCMSYNMIFGPVGL